MSEAISSPSATVDAVVLAGSINRIPLYPGAKPGRKALVQLHGRPLIAPVLDALRDAKGVGRILVVGAPEVLELASQWARVEGVPERGTLLQNVEAGLHAGSTDRLLFCNPDQPLLRAGMVESFLERAREMDADIVSSWVRKESLGRYVEGEHKLAAFGDGEYAHGNLFLVRREFPELEEAKRRLDRLYEARKSNLKFARELGLRLFLTFLKAKITGKLPTLTDTLEMVGRHFGLRIAAVVSWNPEIVLDIDEPEDYAAAERHLAEGAEPGKIEYDPSEALRAGS
jgi:CTP:molybdopterin cytidylyltransferase MocA